jgi:hypothetical protein
VAGDGSSSEYDRGRVDATLTEHGQHLAKINGSMEKVSRELHDLNLGIQRLADAADADRSTVKVTAEALKNAEQARRDKSETSWSPLQRIGAAVAILASLGAIIYYVQTIKH